LPRTNNPVSCGESEIFTPAKTEEIKKIFLIFSEGKEMRALDGNFKIKGKDEK
jgi:hypothetical protein